jgi:hypothetical protein
MLNPDIHDGILSEAVLFVRNERSTPISKHVRVHRIERKVNLSGPRDRAPADENLLEETCISQQRKSTSQFFLPQPHMPAQPAGGWRGSGDSRCVPRREDYAILRVSQPETKTCYTRARRYNASYT